MAQTNTARPWDWTPSPFANAFVSILLRTPLLHRVISKGLLLLTFTGRKSGKRYTTPAGYYREGNTVMLLTKWFRPWWRNFMGSAPVEVRVEGKVCQGIAKALTDETAVIPVLTKMVTQYPMNADIYGIRWESPGKPNMDDVRRIVPRLVAVQITLAE